MGLERCCHGQHVARPLTRIQRIRAASFRNESRLAASYVFFQRYETSTRINFPNQLGTAAHSVARAYARILVNDFLNNPTTDTQVQTGESPAAASPGNDFDHPMVTPPKSTSARSKARSAPSVRTALSALPSALVRSASSCSIHCITSAWKQPVPTLTGPLLQIVTDTTNSLVIVATALVTTLIQPTAVVDSEVEQPISEEIH
ncbi:hypothetical protein ONS95_008007 [Cadophora gregata]|uniref:uncharacterized protein n=1 Tax=Cadophora gregata TaxID=51156 RepID=UPI0026DBA1EB|nr:uncharacterized protein ONS95_008007 [Cadophora gregata]KAK0119147.1 hypothetical protein ONS96_012213 [Cadophora gregata f. sp. sojae]KAK0126404.1 hypothetical protein ONS95_008007 [Cadophora gregata]